MNLTILFKFLFWLQIAALPFGIVIYVFLGITAASSWGSQSVPDAVQTTLGVAAFFAVTLIVIASPWLAAGIAQAPQRKAGRARLLCSLGSGVAVLMGSLTVVGAYSAGKPFQMFIWTAYLLTHLTIVVFVNWRQHE